jgi:hypothetical protein
MCALVCVHAWVGPYDWAAKLHVPARHPWEPARGIPQSVPVAPLRGACAGAWLGCTARWLRCPIIQATCGSARGLDGEPSRGEGTRKWSRCH